MDGLRQYVISVVAAALICGILSGFFNHGAAKELVRLICGLFLAFTVLRPVSGIDFTALTEYSLSFSGAAEDAANMGEDMAQEAMADIIKAETAAYILDKAAELNASITVDVTVNDDNVPVEATISGEISPYARQRLENNLLSELGIAKENQLWTG